MAANTGLKRYEVVWLPYPVRSTYQGGDMKFVHLLRNLRGFWKRLDAELTMMQDPVVQP